MMDNEQLNMVVQGFLEKIAGLPVRYDPFINLGREAVKKYTKKRMINPVLAHALVGGAIGSGIGVAMPNKKDEDSDRLKRTIVGAMLGAGAAGGLKYYQNIARKETIADIGRTIKNPKTRFVNERTPYNKARDRAVKGFASKDTRVYPGTSQTGAKLHADYERSVRLNELGIPRPLSPHTSRYMADLHRKYMSGFQAGRTGIQGDAADKLLDRLKHLSKEQQAKYLHPDALIKRRDLSPKAKHIATEAFKRIRRTHGRNVRPLEEAGQHYRKTVDSEIEKLHKGMGGIL